MAVIETPPALLSAIKAQTADVKVRLYAQIEALGELFELFTAERGRLHRLNYLDTPKYRLAYLRYHLPLNAARTACVLKDLVPLCPEIAGFEDVVDIGAGPGSSSVAALLTLPPSKRRFLLLDKSRGGLRLARDILAHCVEKAGLPVSEIQSRVQKLPDLPKFPRKSLVIMGMVLNELQPGARQGLDLGSLFRRLEKKLEPPSVLVIVEPALRASGLRLMALHDTLVASGRWEVIAPCTHQGDCPLLRAKNRPWCHFHFHWKPGKIVEQIANPLHLKYERSAFSYLALRRIDAKKQNPKRRSDLGRAIGDPMDVKSGGKGIYVCRDGKRETLKKIPPRLKRGDRVEGGKGPKPVRVEKTWPG